LNLKPGGLLQPLPIPAQPWDRVSFDFITGLPVSEQGFYSILVFVDWLTKYAYIYPCHSTISAEGFADFWYEIVFRNEGVSQEFLSDRDPRFTSKFWEEACKLIGTKLARSTAFHPQTDGHTERPNRILETYLRHFVSSFHADWDILLADAQFAYNNAWQESVGNTPSSLNRGRHARIPLGHGLVSVPAAGNFAGRI
jgi:transposase InsO family protein